MNLLSFIRATFSYETVTLSETAHPRPNPEDHAMTISKATDLESMTSKIAQQRSWLTEGKHLLYKHET